MRFHVPSNPRRMVLVAVGLLLGAQFAQAEDTYYFVRLADLKITSGELPKPGGKRVFHHLTSWFKSPYAVLDGAGEVYAEGVSNSQRWENPEAEALAIRAPQGEKITGSLYVATDDRKGLKKLRFVVAADQADEKHRKQFHQTKERHYQRLAKQSVPGTAWFRYQALAAHAAHSGEKLDEFQPERRQPARGSGRETHFEDTFQVFSGGRAVSENLQLDRLLPIGAPAEPTVELASLEGITIEEMDWSELTKEIDPRLDPLASLLPSDQYALLFPSFAALIRMTDEAKLNGTPVLQAVQPRSESARSQERYERQLCLSVDSLSRLLGDQIIKSVALTGSDPYLRTGTDLALLFHVKNGPVLKTYLLTKQAAAVESEPACQKVSGTLGVVSYAGVVSPDRTICSYLAEIGDVIIVTNSLVQLRRAAAVAAGTEASLASLPEYRFFRDRYKRSHAEETALLVVTDQTIRRWCSPKWRIATSRRTRAAAIMAHYQAEQMESLVAGTAESQIIHTKLRVSDLGTLKLTAGGVTSSTYGTLEFLTPISELEFTKVTKNEADTYKRWRAGYQRNWSQFFDPIAVSFSVRDEKIAADMTVMPLIANSDYQEFIAMTSGVKIQPNFGDPHAGSLAHWTMAINPDSTPLHRTNNFFENIVTGGLFGWVGESISLYADPDPYWKELAEAAKQGERHASNFAMSQIHRFPVAFNAEVRDGLRLTLFLSGLRAWIEQTSPNLLTWEALEHNNQKYVKIAQTDGARRIYPISREMAIYYAATPELFTVTLNEDLLKRALDRQSARNAVEKNNAGAVADTESVEARQPAEVDPLETPPPWLGESLALQLDRSVLDLFESAFGGRQIQAMMQTRAWSNLPILNEWKRRHPDRDPVALNQEYWQTALLCPGGGKYVWNEEYQTMESTLYGHPGEPKIGPTVPLPLASARKLEFGLTFENQGLRAQAAIRRGVPGGRRNR